MDQVQKEHQRLWKKAQASKCINDVQATIDLLLEARRTIENGWFFLYPHVLPRWVYLAIVQSSDA